MDGPTEWIAAAGTMLAAALVAADVGRRITGWGFVLFCAVSAVWIVSGLTGGALPLTAMNGVLLLINALGVWQYLLSPKNRRVMERVAPVRQRIEREVEAEVAEEHSRTR
ncbi:MAG: hypothetical protein RLZZ08_2065 [Pseudomonadota bacterium]|jgi:hypothetical protein